VGLDPSGGWKGPIGTMSSPTNGRLITCPSDAGITNVINTIEICDLNLFEQSSHV